jgi:hypothetical protein
VSTIKNQTTNYDDEDQLEEEQEAETTEIATAATANQQVY